jgi:hypothetical protein
MGAEEGHAVFGTWEVGTDRCDFCDQVATEAVSATEPQLRIVRLCPQHAGLAETATGVRMQPAGATCGQLDEHGTPCGAATVQVQLAGFYEGDEAQSAFWPLCRRHAQH